jgi:hypothetical protein
MGVVGPPPPPTSASSTSSTSSTTPRPGPPTRVASIHELTTQGPPPPRQSPASPSRQPGQGQVGVVKRMRSTSPSDSDASSKKARTAEGDRMDVSPSNGSPTQPRSPGTRYEPTKEFGGRPMDERRSPPSNSPKGLNGSPSNQRPPLSSNSSHGSKSEMSLPPITTLPHSPPRGGTPRGQGAHARTGSDMMVEDEDDDRGRRGSGSSGGRSDPAGDKGPTSSPKALKVEGRE